MRGSTLRVIFFVALLSLLAADVSIGCGKDTYVYGPVEQKYVTGSNELDKLIMVSGQTYQVPAYFYDQVSVGDTVKYNGRSWSIVKRADGTVPPKTQTTP
ncbi:MAG TPA: hypothetical protein VKW09_05180 [bacterium]|nr:hypothetical protein [bacterium]